MTRRRRGRVVRADGRSVVHSDGEGYRAFCSGDCAAAAATKTTRDNAAIRPSNLVHTGKVGYESAAECAAEGGWNRPCNDNVRISMEDHVQQAPRLRWQDNPFEDDEKREKAAQQLAEHALSPFGYLVVRASSGLSQQVASPPSDRSIGV